MPRSEQPLGEVVLRLTARDLRRWRSGRLPMRRTFNTLLQRILLANSYRDPETQEWLITTGSAVVGYDLGELLKVVAAMIAAGEIDAAHRVFRSGLSLSHNILHNQIVKATLGNLARCQDDLERPIREESVRLYRRFSNVSDIGLNSLVFDQVVIHRNNRFYAFFVKVCRMLYESVLVDPTTGRSKFRDFVDEEKMHRVFERFVLNFYKREQTQYRAGREDIHWNDVDGDSHALQFLPKMTTDVSLRSIGHIIVIDTKYYKDGPLTEHRGKEKIRSGHLYQLHAYLTNLEQETPQDWVVEGILLYPVVDRNLDLHYRIHGHSVRVATLDLNQHWTAIRGIAF